MHSTQTRFSARLARWALLLPWCLLLPAQAQTTVVVAPSSYANSEAQGQVFWALSPFAARRQLLIEESEIRAGKGQILRSISVRRNAADPVAYEPGQVLLEVWISHSPRTLQTLSPRFADNRGKDEVKLFSGSLSMPRTSRMSKAPASWKLPHQVEIKLGSGFRYDGGSLLIETITRDVPSKTRQPAPWWPIDGISNSSSATQVKILGQSCIAGMGATPANADPGSFVVGGSAHFHLRGLTATQVALFALGFDGRRFGAFMLPLDLGNLGAPGCQLYNEWAFLRLAPVVSEPNAHSQLAETRIALPNMQVFVGKKLFGQWILPDSSANSLGLTFSNGVEAAMVGQPAGPRIGWVEAPSTQDGVGEIMPGRVPVLSFSFTTR